jgi:hypothetical protein
VTTRCAALCLADSGVGWRGWPVSDVKTNLTTTRQGVTYKAPFSIDLCFESDGAAGQRRIQKRWVPGAAGPGSVSGMVVVLIRKMITLQPGSCLVRTIAHRHPRTHVTPTRLTPHPTPSAWARSP